MMSMTRLSRACEIRRLKRGGGEEGRGALEVVHLLINEVLAVNRIEQHNDALPSLFDIPGPHVQDMWSKRRYGGMRGLRSKRRENRTRNVRQLLGKEPRKRQICAP